LGWWTDQRHDPFIPHGAWQACAAETPPTITPGGRVTLGAEIQDYQTAARLVAVVDTDTGPYVELIHEWDDPNGLDEAQIAADIISHARRLHATGLHVDAYSAATLADHVERAGCPVRRLSLPGIRAASTTLLAAVTSGRIHHQDHPTLNREVVNAGRAVAGDGIVRLSRKNSTGTSASAFAIAAALSAHLEPAAPTPRIRTQSPNTFSTNGFGV
jgi:hypothetical protein